MKREDLEKLGLTAEALGKAELTSDVIDKIMSLHGKDIEGHKAKLEAAETTAGNLQTQLEEANKQIEGFKSLPDVNKVQQAADEWKTKYEQAQADNTAALFKMRFDHALQAELGKAKVKNVKAVTPLLDMEALQKGYNEKDDSFLGLDKQLEGLKESDAYLFHDETEPPRIVAGAQPKNTGNDRMEQMLQWAGVPPNKEGK